MKRIIWLVMAGFLVFTAACGGAARSGPIIEVQQPWARPTTANVDQATPGGMAMQTPAAMSGGMAAGENNSAAYLVLRNTGSDPDRLIAARGEVAESVELHQSEMKDGVMSMHPVEYIEVPAGGTAELKPGGYHIMLINVKGDLKPGDKFSLTLVFEKSGEKKVEFEVRTP